MMTKIVLTGGHAATTALAFVEEIASSGWDISWIGSEVAVEGKNIRTLESTVFPNAGVKTYAITTGRLQRRFTNRSIISILKVPLGFFQAFFLLIKIRPDIVLSFGGFASFPVVVSAWLMRIPVVIHEQTCAAGRANLATAFFAGTIAVAREESTSYFPNEKVVVTGNPILREVIGVRAKGKPGNPPNIFITCGSRGAQRVNAVIEEILENTLEKFTVTHLAGPLDFGKFQKIREELPAGLKERYEVYSQIDPRNLGDFYSRSDIILGRSGANTVAEIMVIKRPAILIPIPWTYLDEQIKNAHYANAFGLAKVLPESRLTRDILIREIADTGKNWERIVKSVAGKKSPDVGASSKLAEVVRETLR